MSGDLKRLRIVVGDMPRLLRDIVEDIVRSQVDMEIICRDWSDDMAAALERRHADVVILQDTATDQVPEEPSGAGQAGSPTRQPRWGARRGPASEATIVSGVQGSPRVNDERLVIVTYSERDGGAFSFRPLSIAELSPQALLQAIREVGPAS